MYNPKHCENCLCDKCSNACQGCPSCLYAEYSEKDWEDLKLEECEGYEKFK